MIQKKNIKVEEGLKAIENLSGNLLSFTFNALFKEKEETFYKFIKDDFEFEIDFLKQICFLEEKLALKFTPSNWPRGYRLESCFLASVVFDVAKNDFNLYRDYYTIRIWQDITAKNKHRVFFYFPGHKEEIHINSVLDALGKQVRINKDELTINQELSLLRSFTMEDLKEIGSLYHKEDEELFTKRDNYNYVPSSINSYLKLLEIKHNFSLLRQIESNSTSVVEGIIRFEPLLKVFPVFREIEKYTLHIRIFNNDVSHIYFVYLNHVFSLQDILKYAGVDIINNNNEFEHLITFSSYDLNVIAFLLKEMTK